MARSRILFRYLPRAMKAAVYERYGPPDVISIRDVDPPSVGEHDVLVRVRAAGVGAGDWHLLNATWLAVRLYQGLRRPKRPVLGHDVAGVVERVGAKVERLRPGDEVFGISDGAGCFAELASVPAKGLVEKPANTSFEEAACVAVSGLTALQGLRDKGGIRAGQEVLVNGASGGVGSFAVQLANGFGATVTGVASGPKLDLVRELGAHHTIDYRLMDFADRVGAYDLILDNVGDLAVEDCVRALRPGGRYVAVSGAPSRGLGIALFGGRRAVAFVSRADPTDLELLRDLLARGELRVPLDRTFPLADATDALRYFGSGRARGKIALVP